MDILESLNKEKFFRDKNFEIVRKLFQMVAELCLNLLGNNWNGKKMILLVFIRCWKMEEIIV